MLIMSEKAFLTVSNYIGGKYLTADSYIDSYDPSRGEVWAKIPDSTDEDIEQAVDAAKQAFEE